MSQLHELLLVATPFPDVLICLITQYHVPSIYSTVAAFAAKLANGSVATWGDEDNGGYLLSILLVVLSLLN